MSNSSEFGFLLLGPESCGKTLLLKSLQYYAAHDGQTWDFGSIPRHGRPTIGVDLVNFTLPLNSGDPKKRYGAKKQNTVSILVRELGGQMAPLWPTYFVAGQCDGLIYCIDSLNPFQASRASVELARILRNPKLRETVKAILIVFTKSVDFDINSDSTELTESRTNSTPMSMVELRSMMMLDDILDESRPFVQSIDIIAKCSAVSGVGLPEIFAWLERVARN